MIGPKGHNNGIDIWSIGCKNMVRVNREEDDYVVEGSQQLIYPYTHVLSALRAHAR